MTKKVIICDLDGTLSDCTHRLPLVKQQPKKKQEFHNLCYSDDVNGWCKAILQGLFHTHIIIILSCRPDSHRDMTTEWLIKKEIPHHVLMLRRADDDRPDEEIKEEKLKYIQEKYGTVLFAIDDRPKVCRMYRKNNIQVLQVDDEEF